MGVKIARVRGLLDRYRTDRRLPPSVRGLMSSLVRNRSRSALQRAAARRAVLGADSTADAAPGDGDAGTGDVRPVVRHGARRVQSAGVLRAPCSELTHQFAGAVVDALVTASLDPFLVHDGGDSLRFGLPLEQRERAIVVLTGAVGATGWYLDWADGARTGTVPLAAASDSRRVRRARSWRIYRVDAVGDLAAGPEQAVELTFWHPGTSGQLELIGTRGLERFDARSPLTVEVVDGHEYPGTAAFPVAANFERFREPVDAVYTWVDGSDPAWRASFEQWAEREQRDLGAAALDPARYHSRDELKFSLRSLWLHCGWIRNIYVVTADQTPAWLAEDDRIRVVPHSAILPPSALPTFNSHAIEAALHHIPGLSEHFVYFNDDMFVGRALQPEHFFTPNGLARTFPSGAHVPGFEDDATLAVDTAARRGRELLIERFGRAVTDKPLHAPYPLRRSVLDEIDVEFPEVVRRTTHSRFRSASDLSIAASFGQHYGYAIGKGVLGAIGSAYVNVESRHLGWNLDEMLLGRRHDTFCINETARGDTPDAARERRLREFFEAYFPLCAPWERTSPR